MLGRRRKKRYPDYLYLPWPINAIAVERELAGWPLPDRNIWEMTVGEFYEFIRANQP